VRARVGMHVRACVCVCVCMCVRVYVRAYAYNCVLTLQLMVTGDRSFVSHCFSVGYAPGQETGVTVSYLADKVQPVRSSMSARIAMWCAIAGPQLNTLVRAGRRLCPAPAAPKAGRPFSKGGHGAGGARGV